MSFLAALALVVANVPQDARGLLDAMIERSNALKSFAATYQVRIRTKEAEPRELEGSLRIFYRAPEALSVELVQGEDSTRTVVANGRMSAEIITAGELVQFGATDRGLSISPGRARIGRAFHEEFPDLGDVAGSAGPEVFLRFRVRPGTPTVRPEFHVEGGIGRGNGPLLGWLDAAKRSEKEIALEGESVVWEPFDGARISMRKDTGLIEKIVVTYAGETKTRLELKDLAVDGSVDDAAFSVPAAAPGAKDLSESLGRSLENGQFIAVRALVHRKIRESVEAGTLEWTPEARAHARRVFGVLHEELAPLAAENSVRAADAAVDEFCRWYQVAKKSGPAGEVEAKRTDWEARFRKGLDDGVAPYLARALPETED
ncbi:MAG TPA: hypothetical protein VGR00_11765, partial [Thermoanaerobaculia bacterium]|nr:hypothetical protein [Thermoanaerobaculia bacterium]